MRKVTLGLAVITLLAGCATTQQVADKAGNEWIGRLAKDFFLRYGMPIAQYDVDETTTMYKWNSGVSSVHMPMTANTTAFGTQYGSSAFTTFSGGQSVSLSCEIQLTTHNGRITGMTLHDTIGLWRLSRCDEVLNP